MAAVSTSFDVTKKEVRRTSKGVDCIKLNNLLVSVTLQQRQC